MKTLHRQIDGLGAGCFRRLGWWVLWLVADHSMRLWLADGPVAATAHGRH